LLSDVEEVDTEDFDELVDCTCVETVAFTALSEEMPDSSEFSGFGARTKG